MTSSAAGPWAWYVWHVTWQASLVAGCILVAAGLGRRRSVQWAYGLLVIALVKFALLPAWSWTAGVFGWLAPSVAAPAAPAGWWSVLASLPIVHWLMAVHVLGAAAVAAWLAWQLIRLARLTRRCELVISGPVVVHLGYMTRKMGMLRSVRLLACRDAVEPMAFGVWAPSVIVSADMLRELPPRQVASVLAHELAHHRRGDLWINWLQMILTIVWWFNPLIWMLNRRLRAMREDCCDDLLLDRRLATDDGYCQALLDVAGRLARVRALQWLPRFAERLGPLGARIMRIMDDQTRRRSTWSALRVPALAVLALLILPGLQLRSGGPWHRSRAKTVAAAPAPGRPMPPAALCAPPAPRGREVPGAARPGGPAALPMPTAPAARINLPPADAGAPRGAADVAGGRPTAVAFGAPSLHDVSPLPGRVVMASDIQARLDAAWTSRAASYRGVGVMDALALGRPLSRPSDLVRPPARPRDTSGKDSPAINPNDGIPKPPDVPDEQLVPDDDLTPTVPAGPSPAAVDWVAFARTPTVIRIDPAEVWEHNPFVKPSTPEPAGAALLALGALPLLRRRRS